MFDIDGQKESECTLTHTYPFKVSHATGGILNGTTPLVCGGIHEGKFTLKGCHTLGDRVVKSEMAQSRGLAASIILGKNSDTLFVVGGINKDFL